VPHRTGVLQYCPNHRDVEVMGFFDINTGNCNYSRSIPAESDAGHFPGLGLHDVAHQS